MTYTCPVCGFGKMEDPPHDYNICPCCGTEFDYDNHGRTNLTLRNAWLAQGGHWFSRATSPPQDWNPYAQLSAVGYDYDVARQDTASESTYQIVASEAACAVGA